MPPSGDTYQNDISFPQTNLHIWLQSQVNIVELSKDRIMWVGEYRALSGEVM